MQRKNPDKWDYETFEHLVPRSKGGTDDESNLALAHAKCNGERADADKEPLLLRAAPPSQAT